MKKLIALSLIVTLGGCTQLQNFANGVEATVGLVTGATVTPQQAYIASNAFLAVEASATNYVTLPTCGPGVSPLCKTHAAVVAIAPAIYAGQSARKNLMAAVTAANGAPVSASLLTVLEGQTSTLQTLYTAYGVGK